MNQWVIVAELPEPLRSELAQLRLEIDRWNKRWLPPHVTIIRPFALNLSASAVAEITRPISLTAQLLRWATFRQPGNNGLYLEPTQAPFQHLRVELFRRVPELTKGDRSVDWHRKFAEDPIFHVTIAAGVPDDEIDHIYSKVSPVRVETIKNKDNQPDMRRGLKAMEKNLARANSSGVSQKTYMNVFQIHNLSLYSKENDGFWKLVA